MEFFLFPWYMLFIVKGCEKNLVSEIVFEDQNVNKIFHFEILLPGVSKV